MQRPFFDAHVHWNTTSKEKIYLANKYDAHCLSINTDIPIFPSLNEQEQTIHKLKEETKTGLHYICSFAMENWGAEDWIERSFSQIKRNIANGASGVKLWKNIGMNANLKKEDGSFLMVDDDVFNPIFEYAVENDILLIGHQGEPKNCWLPLHEMTVDSDRNYFAEHPEFHMFKNPKYPSYEEQIEARDNLLRKFPQLRFVGLHLLSLEWNLSEVAKRLDEFPNLMTDLAERICHVQLQAKENWESARNFFIEYQDRIIYGTDVIDDGSLSGTELAFKLERLWKFHWEFFATSTEMEAPEFLGKFKGLNLPKEVLKKIFYSNAADTYVTPIKNKLKSIVKTI